MRLKECADIEVRLDEWIKDDTYKQCPKYYYYTYLKYYELLWELYFKAEDLMSYNSPRWEEAEFAHEAIGECLEEFDADTKKYGDTPKRKLWWKFLARECKYFDWLIKARV